MESFKDRNDAGHQLANALHQYQGHKDVVVVALPRGGVVVGRIVADALGVPFDIVVPRKIGAPENEEYAIGAVAESGEAVWNEVERLRIDPEYLAKTVPREQAEAKRRLAVYRKGLSARDFKNKTVIVVDDGIATGLTMQAAIRSVRAEHPQKIVVAVPVMPRDATDKLKADAGEVVAVFTPDYFPAVGAFYAEFPQVSDEEVVEFLHAPRGAVGKY